MEIIVGIAVVSGIAGVISVVVALLPGVRWPLRALLFVMGVLCLLVAFLAFDFIGNFV